jgi:hypothetical protein
LPVVAVVDEAPSFLCARCLSAHAAAAFALIGCEHRQSQPAGQQCVTVAAATMPLAAVAAAARLLKQIESFHRGSCRSRWRYQVVLKSIVCLDGLPTSVLQSRLLAVDRMQLIGC